MKTVGERLIELRATNNLNKVEFAKMIGVHKSSITRYETNEIKPNLDMLITIKRAFGISLDWLAGFDIEETKKCDAVIDECISLNIAPERPAHSQGLFNLLKTF